MKADVDHYVGAGIVENQWVIRAVLMSPKSRL